MTAAAQTSFDIGLDLSAMGELAPYWGALRKVYASFDVVASGQCAPTGRAHTHKIPAGS